MRIMKRSALALLAVLGALTAALAGPLEDANRAYGQRDYQEALRLLRQAEREQPDNPVVHHALGLTLRRLNDTDGARAEFDKVLQLDPGLRSIRDDAKFWQAYRSLGGTQPAPGASPNSGGGGGGRIPADVAQDIIRALGDGNAYVQPDLKGDVDARALEGVAHDNGAKIVVLAARAQGQAREGLARDLHERLNLPEGTVVLVATPQGVSAYAGRLKRAQVSRALSQARLDQAHARGGLTEAIIVATRAASQAVKKDQQSDTNTTGAVLLLGAGGVAGVLGYRGMRRRRSLEAARRPVEELRRRTVDHLSYVDGYLDLLPAGPDAERARGLRQAAYEEYATAAGTLERAGTPEDVRRAQPYLERALELLEECRAAIDKATGGTGVAMSVPESPSLMTDAERAEAARLKAVEEVRDERERDRMQQTLEEIPENERGVSFFSGRPMPLRELIPVTIVIDGQKREVLATRDEAEAIRRGETPQIRAFEQDGRYVPWYENRGYDPYRDYYGGWGMGGGGFGSLINLYLLTQLFGGGLFGGYGYGPTVIHNHYGGDYGGGGGFFGGGGGAPQPEPEVEHAGSFDFFGQGGGEDSGGGFDFGGGGGDLGGGGDFGGGDFGGGD